MKPSSDVVLFSPLFQYIPRVPRAIISLPWYILPLGENRQIPQPQLCIQVGLMQC